MSKKCLALLISSRILTASFSSLTILAILATLTSSLNVDNFLNTFIKSESTLIITPSGSLILEFNIPDSIMLDIVLSTAREVFKKLSFKAISLPSRIPLRTPPSTGDIALPFFHPKYSSAVLIRSSCFLKPSGSLSTLNLVAALSELSSACSIVERFFLFPSLCCLIIDCPMPLLTASSAILSLALLKAKSINFLFLAASVPNPANLLANGFATATAPFVRAFISVPNNKSIADIALSTAISLFVYLSSIIFSAKARRSSYPTSNTEFSAVL